MSDQPDEALEVLRGVWSAQAADRRRPRRGLRKTKACKKMADVGFDGLAGADERPRAAWRARLEREGKLKADGRQRRDLVLGAG